MGLTKLMNAIGVCPVHFAMHTSVKKMPLSLFYFNVSVTKLKEINTQNSILLAFQ